MDDLRRLEEIFAKFPGIGPRQARRFVYHIQSRSNSVIDELVEIIKKVRSSSSECSVCSRFFIKKGKNLDICSICNNPDRDKSLLMVVSRDSDLEAVERSGFYKGVYFVLGGTVPILDTEPQKRIKLDKYQKIISNSPSLKEIILSLGMTPDGENTSDLIHRVSEDIAKKHGFKITILGRGISKGAELEYVDGDTIKSALDNRH